MASYLQYRYPDNPMRVSPGFVKELEQKFPGAYGAQRKGDGWRRPGYHPDNATWEFYSKHDEQKAEPPGLLVNQVRALRIPEGTALDMEWMGRRKTEYTNGRHWFEVFDLLYWRGEWMGDRMFRERHAILSEMFGHWKERAGEPTPDVLLLPVVTVGLHAFYESQLRDPLSEGIVVKRLTGNLVGSLARTTDNGTWYKCKYRD